jgi:hypothetical protein
MKRVSTYLLASFMVSLAFSAALAEDPKEKLVDQILRPSEFQETSNTYMAQYAKEFVRSWKTTLLPMDVATEETLMREFTKRLTTDDMVLLPKIKQLYLDIFTVEELEAMLAFYDSPVGKTIAAKTKILDEEVAKRYYPGINDKAIKHWNETVQSMRAAGRKL